MENKLQVCCSDFGGWKNPKAALHASECEPSFQLAGKLKGSLWERRGGRGVGCDNDSEVNTRWQEEGGLIETSVSRASTLMDTWTHLQNDNENDT